MTMHVSTAVVTSQVHPRLLCHSLSLGVHQIQPFLGHDPRSRHWKMLPETTRSIYERIQRPTASARIEGLKRYLGRALLKNGGGHIGAVIPLSIGQFTAANIEDGVMVETAGQSQRIVLDGLARITAFMDLLHDDAGHSLLDDTVSVPVALYAPTEGQRLSVEELGQLFADFNRYAIPVQDNLGAQLDMFDPYVNVAKFMQETEEVEALGGVKWANTLGKSDQAFMTGVGFAKFVRICCEGERGYPGKLTRIVRNPWLSDETRPVAIANIQRFLRIFVDAMPAGQMQREGSIMRTSHFWHALGVICNDLVISAQPRNAATKIAHLASLDWSWANPDLQAGIGRYSELSKTWSMNTGTGVFRWMVRHMREINGMKKAA